MNVMRTLGGLAAVLACAAVAAAPAGAADERADLIGGSPAPAGAWPSIAYLRGYYHDTEGREEEFACSGSVVAPQWILTAAHCTFGEGDGPPERMVATLGVTDYTDPAGESLEVDRFVPDPSYDQDKLTGDVGLIHLRRPTSRPPMPLATTAGVAAEHYVSPPGVPNAAGWGAVDEDGTDLPTKLQQAYLQIRTSAQCSSLIPGFDPNTETCAGTSGRTGACFGDSGGPLVEIDSTTQQRALWGVTSYGPQIEEDLAPCSVDVPAVYTWIPAYAQFIQSTIAGSATAVGSAPAPAGARAGEPTRARTATCKRARTAVTAARRRERRALRRLRAARRDAVAGRLAKRARRSYRAARTHRRRVIATAARRCRA